MRIAIIVLALFLRHVNYITETTLGAVVNQLLLYCILLNNYNYYEVAY